ncbi:ESX secretion-associated protein EspG [Nocardia iowensis]|uniref:ESX secretion-associated protein EspG n=1 Tax=Nocardia iowensis TaxID=204891 RepID=A0ABX8S0F0_NOCIO|nr:ESX secretion-associated protein EspG [Nocardia iowensis]QXN94677.1 ESX secretion-associated protein EspG [Nocardia iowensis]
MAHVDADPVVIDLNVDAALALMTLAGIDEYPAVLALLPNVFRVEDQERVHAVMVEELAHAGILDDDGVHPRVRHWLQCLYRPDMELVARIVDTGVDCGPQAMLRMSLVRRDDTHVLALRCDDHVVIQPVFVEGRQLPPITGVVAAALGPREPLRFEPMSATLQQFTDVPSEPDERRQVLRELGAGAHTAAVLTRALGEVVRRAEVLMVEHRDGGSTQTEVCVSVLDTLSGRILVTPSRAVDGRIWSTYAPGDGAAVHASIGSLLELLPGRSWFDTVRTD